MPRKERKHSETGIYHVMLRSGANQRPVPPISVIYFDTISEEIIDKTFDYDAYYSASPMNIFAMPPTYNEKVIVKSGNKLVIKNGNQGVKIRNNFECEKGAVFEVK